MMRSFVGVLERDRGYAPTGVVSLNVTLPLPSARFEDPAARAAAFEDILGHVARIPGVAAAGATNGFPGSRLGVLGFGNVLPVGRQVDAPITAALHSATPDFFRTMDVALERGRFFDAGDRAGSAPVVIVNASLAAKLWPDSAAVGQRVRMDDGLGGGEAEVVGIVEDMHLLEESVAGLYRPLAQKSGWWVDLVARTDGDAQALTGRIRTSLRAFNPDLLLENESSLSAIVRDSIGLERAQSLFTSALAMLGCLLAAMGVSALLTYDVARRTREMGVRLALGCRPAQLYWGVVRRGVLLASTGVAIGCVSAIVAVRALRSTVFGLESGLLIGCATAALLILVSALVAAAIPARRVVRTDPLEALRVS
jgi:hypothetical protein